MAVTARGARLTDIHRRRQVRMAITADSQARRLWDATLDMNDLDGSQERWREAMLNLIQKWWKVSAEEAQNYMPRFRLAETGDDLGRIVVAMPRFDRATAARDLEWLGGANVKWHIGHGDDLQSAYSKARSLFVGSFHEAVLTGGRSTIREWADKDTRAIGWRRVSDGDPCAFCAMLVGRGPVYRSSATAAATAEGGKFHNFCGCTVEVVYGDWQPNELEAQWVDAYFAASSRFERGQRTQENVLPLMRANGSFRDSPSRRKKSPKV